MHEINLRGVDLNLLTVFEVVYEEQSQIKAAERLGMTQSAISHALGRLRYLVGDTLFQGRSKGLTPTSQADDFYLRVHEALDLVRAELAQRQAFDPGQSQRTFVISMDYGGGALLGVRLFQRVAVVAPHVRLFIRTIDPVDEIPRLLREHRLDLAFNTARLNDDMLEHLPLWESQLCVLVKINHPRIHSNPSLEDILQERFVNVHETHITTHDEHLSTFIKTVKQHTAMEIPNAALLPYVLESTDLIAVSTVTMAEAMSQRFALVHFPVPVQLPPFFSNLIWHRSMTNDPAHAWFREQFRTVIAS
ncbi:MAG: LysR substrate-binding domain-containing protein [Methylococcaceae bacterium]|jgi:DNA-binding transcriptional LysR family regulator